MAKTITVNVDEETVQKFKRFVRMKYGKRKGVLGRAAAEAFNELVSKNEGENADAWLLARIKKGYRLGKIIGRRSDWHARKPFL